MSFIVIVSNVFVLCTMKIPKKFKEELEAMRISAKYNLVDEYKYTRRKGFSITQALQEWDLYDYKPPHQPPLSAVESRCP